MLACCYCSPSFNLLFIRWETLDFRKMGLVHVWRAPNNWRALNKNGLGAVEIETLSHLSNISHELDLAFGLWYTNAARDMFEAKCEKGELIWLMVTIYNHAMYETCIQITSFSRVSSTFESQCGCCANKM